MASWTYGSAEYAWCRMLEQKRATSWSFVTIMPPSPVVMFFVAYSE